MRVFVAFGYLRHELWVRDLVIPMLKYLNIEVLQGEEIPGGSIEREVRRRIQSADALIGFLLQRTKNPDDTWTSSTYVQQEINVAAGLGMAVIQVVEKGVPPVGAMLAGTQHLEYEADKRADFLVRLLGHIQILIEGEVYVRLAPDDLVHAIAAQSPAVAKPCEYDVLHQGHVERSGTAPIFGRGGGMYVKLVGFRPDRYANLTIEANGKRWSSLGVAHSDPFVTVQLAPVP